MPNPWMHTKCGGEVDVKKRICLKCGHKWGPLEIWSDPVGLRQVRIPEPRKVGKRTYASWAEKVPYVSQVASVFPAWKRGYRLLLFFGVLILVVLLILFVGGYLN